MNQDGEGANVFLPLAFLFLPGERSSKMTYQKEVLIEKSPHGRKTPTKQEC